ncbi:MAG: hypothetical protein K2X47_12895, partial [Bdellovibrionales bacterium]|nr:hypothetical protein [Bdellovibrionales bacterium]
LPVKASPSPAVTPPLEMREPEPSQTTVLATPKAKAGLGFDLNSFFYGPGIATGAPGDVNPGYDGQPTDVGLYFFNLMSLKWRFSERYAFDVQFRNQLTVTNASEARFFDHQGQRFGISGKLLKGENWSISGAVNTDIPLEIGGTKLQGQINSERKLLFNPGAFAFWSYTPPGTRWSGFALLSPRFFIYSDANAVSRQDLKRAEPLAAKPEYFLFINPSINYAVTPRLGIRFGATIDYSKMIAWSGPKRNYAPFELGVTYDVTPTFSIYPYILGSSPIDDYLRKEQGAGNIDWRQTWSFNIWLSGSLF